MRIHLPIRSLAWLLLLATFSSCHFVDSTRRIASRADRSASRTLWLGDPERWAQLAYGSFEPRRWPSRVDLRRQAADLSNLGIRLAESIHDSADRLRNGLRARNWTTKIGMPLRRFADIDRWRRMFRGGLVDATDPRRVVGTVIPRPRGYFERLRDRFRL